MPTIDQAKAMAKRLRTALAARDIDIPHAAALELIAAELGHDNWNIASAKLDPAPADPVRYLRAIPILRIFDEAKAREFYCGFLGFAVDFEHRFEPKLPLYMQVSRAGLQIHLSEHHGDASPGSTTFVPMVGVRSLHKELKDKDYGYGRPGIEQQPWGDVLTVHDPFGNRIRFCQDRAV
jgi:catechol 2,3-dioxygenase-like lactoylglutathione lyase family enzyme